MEKVIKEPKKETEVKQVTSQIPSAIRSVKLKEISMLTKSEQRLILDEFNDTAVAYPRDKTIVQLFEEQVEKTPNQTAVVFNEESITYQELNEKANLLAYQLRALGVKPDEYVGIIAERSARMVIGIYGIIKAGGAYVPIDPAYPPARIQYILDDCRPKAVLAYQTEVETQVPVIDLGEVERSNGACENPIHVNAPTDLIYCIYTSGTTGMPKGVMIEHKSTVNLVKNYIHRVYEGSCTKTVLLNAPYYFDMSIKNIFGALVYGATLHIADEEMRLNIPKMYEYINKNKIDLMDCTPQHLKMLSEISFSEIALKAVLVGGEKLGVDLVRRFENYFEIHNGYGPTETSVNVTWHHCSKQDLRDIPIGPPIPNIQIYIMSDETLCGIRMSGELCVAGIGVARGYLNQPELTAEKFIDNPFGEGKLYRTGDLARWLPDGKLEYLGRMDEQVQIRGFRIELGEIESALRQVEAIIDVVAHVQTDHMGHQALCAYVKVKEDELNTENIRLQLRKTLPEHMIPTHFMKIDHIPVTRNGKVNRKALPKIEITSAKVYVAPTTTTEETMVKIFEEMFGIQQIGIKESFFELGGNSLKAMLLVNRIEQETGVRLGIRDIFQGVTVEGISLALEGIDGACEPIPKVAEKEYYPLSPSQRTYFLTGQLWDYNGVEVAYNIPAAFEIHGDFELAKARQIVEELIKRHDVFRTSFHVMDDETVYRIHEHVQVDVEYKEMNAGEDIELFARDFVRPFDLTKAPLIRSAIIKTKEERFVIFMDIHHVIADGISYPLFMEEFMTLYTGGQLPKLDVQYKDYSEWALQRDLAEQKAYWLNRFADGVPSLKFPLDYPRPKKKSFEGNAVFKTLDKKLRNKVVKLAEATGATEYMVLLSILMILLSKYSKQEDIVVGSAASVRTHRDTEKMQGLFVNRIMMRGKPEKEKSVIQFVKEMREDCLAAYENKEYSFDTLVQKLDLQQDKSRYPLFDILFAFEGEERSQKALEMSGLTFKTPNFKLLYHKTKLDMMFNIVENDGNYTVMFRYATDLFKRETIEAMIENFIYILKQLDEEQDQIIGEITCEV